MNVRRYRKRPVTVEAIQFTGDNAREIAEFLGHEPDKGLQGEYGRLMVHTLEGDMEASRGDYIIRGVAGEPYPCKPAIFNLTYELADD